MIKWFIGLIFKDKRPLKEQINAQRERQFDNDYNRGWDHAKALWNSQTPNTIVRDILSKQMGNVETAYEIGIWDFLKSQNGVR